MFFHYLMCARNKIANSKDRGSQIYSKYNSNNVIYNNIHNTNHICYYSHRIQVTLCIFKQTTFKEKIKDYSKLPFFLPSPRTSNRRIYSAEIHRYYYLKRTLIPYYLQISAILQVKAIQRSQIAHIIQHKQLKLYCIIKVTYKMR